MPVEKVDDTNSKMEEAEKTVNQIPEVAVKTEDFSNLKTVPTNEFVAPKRASKFFDK